MSDFLATMAHSSAERAAAAGPIDAAQLDKPVVPLNLGAFDVIAEIKNRSPAEGELTARGVDRENRVAGSRRSAGAAQRGAVGDSSNESAEPIERALAESREQTLAAIELRRVKGGEGSADDPAAEERLQQTALD